MPLGGTRSESIQRLQIGLSGIVGMLMLVALADVIRTSADDTDASSVPQAAATVAADAAETKPTDPMVEAGVVPDLPTDPAKIPDQNKPVLPEQGAAQTPD